MKKIFLLTLLVIASQAADSFKSWFEEGEAHGYVRYYYIETNKDIPNASSTSAYANAVGGVLSYTTGNWNGFETGASFMTTNGFSLPDVVDTSILARDDGVRLEGNPGGDIAQASITVLGEAFIKYGYKDFELLYGRQVMKTSLIHAKDVRMLPSAVQGAFVNYKLSSYGTDLAFNYLTHFKQRTSSKFVNIVEHALGDNTRRITGDDEGDVLVFDAVYDRNKVNAQMYNYYADDFMNSFYLDFGFKNDLSSGMSYYAAVQYINQMSVGNAEDNLKDDLSLAGGEIDVNSFALKAGVKVKESTFEIAWSKVLSNDNKHDSLVLPWDGTPLFTNMITSNDLFQSNYGKALNADSIYIGGSAGVKVAYNQTYGFTGIKGLKTSLAYLNISNNKFANNQRDYNAVIAYGIGSFTLALKGIWVRHESSANATGQVTQIDKLNQYRVIMNYKF
jgi:hypothetical protein